MRRCCSIFEMRWLLLGSLFHMFDVMMSVMMSSCNDDHASSMHARCEHVECSISKIKKFLFQRTFLNNDFFAHNGSQG